MRKIIMLLLANVLMKVSYAQSYIEPIIGYQIDIKNDEHFKQFNTGLLYSFVTSSNSELSFEIKKSNAIGFKSNSDTAFTPNPSLPLQTSTNKTIKPSVFSLSIINRFVVAKINETDKLVLLLKTGYAKQKLAVNYDYDKNNYTVLNPDITQKRASIYFGAGVEYIKQLKVGRAFGQLNICSEPIGRSLKYPSSFKYMTLLSIDFGYSIPLKFKKDEKQ